MSAFADALGAAPAPDPQGQAAPTPNEVPARTDQAAAAFAIAHQEARAHAAEEAGERKRAGEDFAAFTSERKPPDNIAERGRWAVGAAAVGGGIGVAGGAYYGLRGASGGPGRAVGLALAGGVLGAVSANLLASGAAMLVPLTGLGALPPVPPPAISSRWLGEVGGDVWRYQVRLAHWADLVQQYNAFVAPQPAAPAGQLAGHAAGALIGAIARSK